MQIVANKPPVYDAVIVGSGATSGWVAKTLSESGMKVLVLEAGPKVTDADFTEHVQPYDLQYRGASPAIARNRPIQAMKYATRESNYHWFVDDIRNPYTTPEFATAHQWLLDPGERGDWMPSVWGVWATTIVWAPRCSRAGSRL